MEAVECGAAALAIILAHHGRWVPLAQLRAQCDVGRDGSKVPNMLKVAQQWGLETHAYRRNLQTLWELSGPFIVFWNFNHFVVVEGRSSDFVFLNDPATGPRKVTHQEFDRSYTGIVLTFKPTTDFVKGGRRPSLWGSLRPRLKGSGSGVAFVVLASFGTVVPGLLVPAFLKVFVDEILTRGQHDWILGLLLAILSTAVVSGLLSWLQGYYLLRLQTRLAVTSSAGFLWHLLRLPLEFYAQRFSGEIGSRVRLNDEVAALLSGKLASAALAALTIVCYAVVMLFYDVTLTLITVVMALINVAALIFVSRLRTDANSRLLQDQGKLVGSTMSGLQMIETLKSTGRESDFFARWAGYQSKVVNVQQELGLATQTVSVLPTLVVSLANLAIICAGGYKVIQGEMSLGMVMAFQALQGQFLGPVNQLVSVGGQLQEAMGDLNRLDDVLLNPTEEAPSPTAERAPLRGELELRGVTFGYSKLSEPLLKDFDLHLKPGQRVALVGGTGSGKSTLARLVCGLYQPWSGQVAFDGIARQELPRDVQTSGVSYVDQDVVMFAGTLRENLTLWDISIPDEVLIQALQDAHVYEAVAARPGALSAVVGENGQNFSGGERQRLEIARALVQNPAIIVMDEATSALDPIVEKTIDDRLRARGCTTLVIAHRLSTIRDADEIVVLDGGRAVQRGTHQQLVASEGPYRRLIQLEGAPEDAA